MVGILRTTVEWVDRLQASNSPTLSLVFVARREIIASLQPMLAVDVAAAAGLRAKLLTSLTKRLDTVVPVKYNTADAKYLVRWKFAHTAALLDIRTVMSELDVFNSHFDVILDFIANSYLTWQPPAAAADAAAAPQPAAPAAIPAGGALAALQARLAQAPVVSPIEAAKKQVETELAAYLDAVARDTAGKTQAEMLQMDPLAWWRSHKSSFPYLSHVARSLFSVQATSAASERVFSSAGFISSATRSVMSPDTLELCVMVRSATRNGIDIRAELAQLFLEKKEAANAKRSAATKAQRAQQKAAKRARVEGAAAAAAAAAAEAVEEEEPEAAEEPLQGDDLEEAVVALQAIGPFEELGGLFEEEVGEEAEAADPAEGAVDWEW
jgi:hAT family C-terminal dimerisation region